jgi:concentrative nucleoside transporter, CNT family
MERVMSAVGLVVLIGVAYLLSENRKKIDKRVIFWGVGLQVILAILIFGIPRLGVPGLLRPFFSLVNDAVLKLLSFSDEGAKFVFGGLAVDMEKFGFIFAFRVLPTIIFFSAIIAVLYYVGILQKIVAVLAFIIRKFLRASGAESLSTAANIFVGQTEAPLLIKPYLLKMTRSELLCIMVGGMANTAGGVLAAYVMLLHERFPDIAGHLLTVSVMSAPATLLISKILVPETESIQDEASGPPELPPDSNVLEAATRGASEGLSLALNVAAMLLAFIALMAMLNGILGWAAGAFGGSLTLQQLLGWVFSPLAFLLGVPWSEATVVGRLLGEKIVLNEFVAYLSLSDLTKVKEAMSDRAVLISSYALCGFANFSSIGIQIGGIGAMAPERRGDLARLGIKALIGGNLATFTCACIVGMLL